VSVQDLTDEQLFARRDEPAERAELVRRYDGLAHSLAWKFRRPATSMDDLIQVARYGLLNALDRFDPDLGFRFTTYAARVIIGEIKHHFRDNSWSMRVTRSVQNLYLHAGSAQEELAQVLGRRPTVPELADHLGVGTDELLEALGASSAMWASSLEDKLGEGDDRTAYDVVGGVDATLETAAEWSEVETILANMDGRLRKVLTLRFFEGLSQQEIANEIGVSQVQVSRLLRSAFKQVRSEVEGD
jgi:RNA polymerase sigma-B factor